MATKKDNELQSWTSDIEKYSRQIWLAGLGAFSKVSKDGSSFFDALVEDGEKAQKFAKNRVSKQVSAVKSSVGQAKSRVGEVKDKAVGKWNELEEAFDKRLNSAISRLGVPSHNEVMALHAKVEQLAAQIEQLLSAQAASHKTRTRTTVAKKTPVRTTAQPASTPAPKSAPKKAP